MMVSENTGGLLDVADLDLVGGRLCLDFANTTSMRETGRPRERLHRYDDLVRWSVRAGVLNDAEAAGLTAGAAADPAEAERVLARAIELRESIFALAEAAVRGDPPPREPLDRLNGVLAEGMARRRLLPGDGGLRWAWADDASLDRLLWPIAQSAGEVLSSSEVDRVRQCGDDSCDWFFFDASRNGTRRWCVMSDCGNRAKARRHYHRSKRSRDPDSAA
jgi:predicted RNA-binding Zn ribbon-like protein